MLEASDLMSELLLLITALAVISIPNIGISSLKFDVVCCMCLVAHYMMYGSSKSVKRLLGYSKFSFFQDGGHPSWICGAHLKWPTKSTLSLSNQSYECVFLLVTCCVVVVVRCFSSRWHRRSLRLITATTSRTNSPPTLSCHIVTSLDLRTWIDGRSPSDIFASTC